MKSVPLSFALFSHHCVTQWRALFLMISPSSSPLPALLRLFRSWLRSLSFFTSELARMSMENNTLPLSTISCMRLRQISMVRLSGSFSTEEEKSWAKTRSLQTVQCVFSTSSSSSSSSRLLFLVQFSLVTTNRGDLHWWTNPSCFGSDNQQIHEQRQSIPDFPRWFNDRLAWDDNDLSLFIFFLVHTNFRGNENNPRLTPTIFIIACSIRISHTWTRSASGWLTH